MRYCLILAMLLAMIVACNGCGEFGGRTVSVMLDSEPNGAEAYLIPQLKWDRYYGVNYSVRNPDCKNLSRWFSWSYREGGTQVTPVQAKVSGSPQVYLVRKRYDGEKSKKTMWGMKDWINPKEGVPLYVELGEDCEE